MLVVPWMLSTPALTFQFSPVLGRARELLPLFLLLQRPHDLQMLNSPRAPPRVWQMVLGLKTAFFGHLQD